jgi:hypothetical protein
MEIGGSNQRIAADTKLFYMKLLTTPQRNGKAKTVREVSSEYPVTPKSLYEWHKDYQLLGDAAFVETPRKVSASKSSDLELQEEIFRIALLNPLLSAYEIIEVLRPAHKRITAPTVQKILKIRNLNTLKLRTIGTEYEYVKKHLPISKQTLDYLIKKNPYLDLLQINAQIAGSLFYLKCLDLTKLYGPKTGYLLVAVDTKSLTTFSQVWDGKYLDVPVTFVKDLSEIFGKKDKENTFESDDSEVFRDLKKSQPMNQINWLDSGKHYFSPARFEIAISDLVKHIQTKFLKIYKFTSAGKLQSELEKFLLMHRISDGPDGYPTFGQPPHHLTKYNIY